MHSSELSQREVWVALYPPILARSLGPFRVVHAWSTVDAVWLSTTLSTSYPRTRGTSPDVNSAAARAMAARTAGPRIPVFPRDSAGIQWAGFGVMDSAPVSAAARCFTPPTLYSHTCTQPCARPELRNESSAHEPITPTFHVKHLAPDSTSRRRTCETIEARAMTLRHPDEDMPYQSAAGIARRKSGFSTSGARTQRCTRLRRVGEYGTGLNAISRRPTHWPGSGLPLGRPDDADATA